MYLTALVLRLRAAQSFSLGANMGRALQQFAIAVIRQHEPTLAEVVHDSGELKPFGAAGVFQPGPVRPLKGGIAQGDQGWVRLTGINSEVCAALEAFSQKSSSTVEIDRHPWEITAALLDSQVEGWSGRTTPQTLWQHHAQAPTSRTLTMRFATPTAFHSQGRNMPFPLPLLVFGSLIDRWNTFVSLPMPDLMPIFVDQMVVISQYRVETRLVHFQWRGGKESVEIGFVGAVTYEVLERHKAPSPGLSEAYPMLLRALHLLGSFAFFSGVGIKTSMGMGMCRCTGGKVPQQEDTLAES